MPDVWTHGKWTVRPGREEEFVQALGALAREARDELGIDPPLLLRHREQPNVFLTFSSWPSEVDIERFREFLFPRLGPMRELVESFEPHTLDEVSLD
ncbi:MAG: antibiotic biosynthesis monooxygenase [Thermoleophilia bacterium]